MAAQNKATTDKKKVFDRAFLLMLTLMSTLALVLDVHWRRKLEISRGRVLPGSQSRPDRNCGSNDGDAVTFSRDLLPNQIRMTENVNKAPKVQDTLILRREVSSERHSD